VPKNYITLNRADRHEELGDFTTALRTIPISRLAIPIGVLCVRSAPGTYEEERRCEQTL
jgi:hypothetical protein